MTDILIHIPDAYDEVCDTIDTDLEYFLIDYLGGTVATCKRLPKGHGKIVDLGKIDEDRIEKDNPVIYLTVNGEYIEAISLNYLNDLRAIVEADKSEEDK